MQETVSAAGDKNSKEKKESSEVGASSHQLKSTVVPCRLPSRRSMRLLLRLSAAAADEGSAALGEGLSPLQAPWLPGLPKLVKVAPAAGGKH